MTYANVTKVSPLAERLANQICTLICEALDRDAALRASSTSTSPLAPAELFPSIPPSPYLLANELYELYDETDSYSPADEPPSQASVTDQELPDQPRLPSYRLRVRNTSLRFSSTLRAYRIHIWCARRATLVPTSWLAGLVDFRDAG
jgi:hypothetical protein